MIRRAPAGLIRIATLCLSSGLAALLLQRVLRRSYETPSSPESPETPDTSSAYRKVLIIPPGSNTKAFFEAGGPGAPL